LIRVRKFINHTPANDTFGVIEVLFYDRRVTTMFNVAFELTWGFPFSELAAFPHTPLFGQVTVVGIAATLSSIKPGFERNETNLERACAALLDLAIAGCDPQAGASVNS
jgi:hypothetical protein